jgi:hypothetical protein
MHGGPFQHHRQGAPWKAASQYRKGLNPDQSFAVSVDGVKVRGVVIAEVHADHNPKESGYFRHSLLRFYAFSQAMLNVL